MSTNHPGGNLQNAILLEEHVGLANAKRVVISQQDTGGSGYVEASVTKLTNSNAAVVLIVDSTSGSPISVSKNPSVLYDGVLPSAVAALYTVTTGKKSWITSCRVRNTSASQQTVQIGYRATSGGTTRSLWNVVLETGESAELIDGNPFGMGSGSILRGSTTSTNSVDIAISGEEI